MNAQRVSPFAQLPIAQWASHCRRGGVSLRGRPDGQAVLQVGPVTVRLCACTARVSVDYRGGSVSTGLHEVVIRQQAVTIELSGGHSHQGRRLRVTPDRLVLDGLTVAAPEGIDLELLVRDLAEVLGDLSFTAFAEPQGDLTIRFGPGMVVDLPAGARVTVSGAMRGPAASLQISEPIELFFGGEGIQISHEQLQMLSRILKVQLSRARLHPDGEVHLEGHGAKGFDLAVRGGLRTASAQLSHLIRRNPRFGRVRAFLRHT